MAVLTIGMISMSISAQSKIVIKGAPAILEENIRLVVTQPPEQSNSRQLQRYMNSLPEQVVAALSAYGYYAADVNVSSEQISAQPSRTAAETLKAIGSAVTDYNNSAVDTQRSESITQINVDITLNDPVRISAFSLEFDSRQSIKNAFESGESSSNASTTEGLDRSSPMLDFAETRSQIETLLAIGNPFVSADYEAAKSSLLSRAQDLGYFDFEFTKTEVRVSRANATANITLIATPGQRYTFGNILFQQRTFSDSFMNRWLPFAPGDTYEASLIGDLTQNLQNSGYFASVRVRPLVDPRYEQTVPVAVDLAEIEHNKVALGLGFSTDTGIRGTVTWDKPLINTLGHSAEWSTSVSSSEQSATFSYRIPRKKQPLFNYWGLEYGLRREEIDEIESTLNTVNFQRVSRTRKNWTESFFIRWERETSVTSSLEDTTNLLLPGFSYSRSRSKGEPFPTWGQSVSFQVLGGSRQVLSTIDFIKTEARFRALKTFFDRNSFIGTLQYGAIHASDNDRVPASQRFFVGGDRTVRGFAYRSLSPENEDGEAIGGRFLEVFSAEYNYRFRDRWSLALFTDAGRAFNTFDTGYSVGAGVGIRWQSPVGAFRIDLAAPVSDNDTGSFRIHLSLGADL